MRPLTVDDIREVIPDLDELRPFADQIVAQSHPDPDRRWAGSGALGTAESRVVDTAALQDAVRRAAEREQAHTQRLYSILATSITHLEAENRDGCAEMLLEAAALEEGRDRPARAAAYATAAIDVVGGGGHPALASLALRRRARAHRTAGRLKEAQSDYERAHEIALAAGDSRGAAEAAIGAGNVLEEKGHWADAEARYRTALKVLDSEGGPVPEEWHALLNLHVVLRSSGDIQGSQAPLDRAEAIARDLEDESAIQFLENARGQSLMASGDFGAAIDRFRTAISASTGARASVTIRLNLAEALLAVGRNLDAAEEARKAEREALAARLNPKLPEVYRVLGRVSAADENPDAFVLFERALDIIRTRALPELEMAITLQAYADAERRVGEAATANELKARADAIYQQLGIQRSRSEWADQYGSGQRTDGNTTGSKDEDAP